MVVIKVSYNNDIRRITVDEQAMTYKDLRQLLRKLYSLPTHFDVKYLDDEGDQVTVSSDRELTDAFNFVRSSNDKHPQVLRLTLLDAAPKKKPADAAPKVEEKAKEKEQPAAPSSGVADAFSPAQLLEVIEAALGSPEVQQTLTTVQDTFSTCVEQAVREGRTAAHYVQQHPQFNRVQRLLTERLPQAIHDDLNTTIPQLINEIQGIFANIARPQPVSPAPAASSTSSPGSGVRHHAICDACEAQIVGIRYKCTVCPDYDLCEACEPRPGVHDPSHYFLKLRSQLPWNMEHSRLLQPQPIRLGRPSRCPYFQQQQQQQQQTQPQHPSPLQPQPEGKPQPQFHRPRFHHGCSRFALSARFIADVSVEDGSVLAPNVPFVKVWRLRNDGDRAWPEGTSLTHIFGPRLATSATVPVPALPAGEEVDIAVEMVSPAEPGHYVSNWRLSSPRGYKFGHRIWADINVAQPAEEQPKQQEEPVPAPVSDHEEHSSSSSESDDEEFEVIHQKDEQPSAAPSPSDTESEPEPAEQAPAAPAPAPEPTPVPEPAQPQSQPAEDEPEGLRNVLDQLHQMGFHDRALNKRLLLKYRGNVLATVHQLLEQ